MTIAEYIDGAAYYRILASGNAITVWGRMYNAQLCYGSAGVPWFSGEW